MSFKKIALFIISLLLLLGLFVTGVNLYVLSFSENNYYTDVKKLEEEVSVGLVFGASVKRNREPSTILKDRLKVAFYAYKKGKINKLVLSGDNSEVTYNEPASMEKYLLELGVKKEDIYLDFAGFDTYDSLYRAREVFKIKKVVLFTQDFHLERAMYIADRLGLEAYGVQTNLQSYHASTWNNFREKGARVKAFLEADIFKPKPKFLGDPIKILTEEVKEEKKEEILKN